MSELHVIEKVNDPRPFTALVLIILLLVMGAGALISGPMLFLAPDGRLMQWTVEQLEGTPFTDYLVPGIILFLLVGVLPVFTGIGLIKKPAWRWPEALNVCKGFHWSWTGAWASGVIMLIWIITETALLGYVSFLQPLVAAWGIGIIILTMLPGVRRNYRKP